MNDHRRLPRWIPLGWAVTLLLAMIAAAPPATAAHRHVPDGDGRIRHLNEMHYASAGSPPGTAGGMDEQYCVESHDPAYLSSSRAKSFVRETLTLLDFSKIWDGTGDWKVDLYATANPCSSYSGSTRETIEIEYHYGWNWSHIPTCGDSISNCVEFSQSNWDPNYGHTDYTKAKVYLLYRSGGRLDSVGRAFINHETGHVLGLRDPDYPTHCPGPSIMHTTYVSYGCSDWPYWYPSPRDFASVKTVMAGG